MRKLYNLFGLILLLTIIAVVYLFIFSYLNYVDFPNGCIIRIDKNVLNKTNSTREKLKEIRRNDIKEYKVICKNIDKITEIDCRESEYGCYLNGTKTIHIEYKADKEKSKEAIINFAYMSKQYHEGREGLYFQILKVIL